MVVQPTLFNKKFRGGGGGQKENRSSFSKPIDYFLFSFCYFLENFKGERQHFMRREKVI